MPDSNRLIVERLYEDFATAVGLYVAGLKEDAHEFVNLIIRLARKRNLVFPFEQWSKDLLGSAPAAGYEFYDAAIKAIIEYIEIAKI